MTRKIESQSEQWPPEGWQPRSASRRMAHRDILHDVLSQYDRGVAPSANEVVNAVYERMGDDAFHASGGGKAVRKTLSDMVNNGEVQSRWDTNPGTQVFWALKGRRASRRHLGGEQDWEDVNVTDLKPGDMAMVGKTFGKVKSIKPHPDNPRNTVIHFHGGGKPIIAGPGSNAIRSLVGLGDYPE